MYVERRVCLDGIKELYILELGFQALPRYNRSSDKEKLDQSYQIRQGSGLYWHGDTSDPKQ